MDTALQAFLHGCDRLNIPLDPAHRARFDRYHREIRRWNTRVRLVSPRDAARIPVRHFLDALLPLHFDLIPEHVFLIDIGSGAGFPGIPIAICRPEARVALVESNRKKAAFLAHCVRLLGLKNVEVACDRVEARATGAWKESGDVVCARAVAPFTRLLDLAMPALKPGGSLIAHKGPAYEGEIACAEARLVWWGAEVIAVHRVALPELPLTTSIVVIRKGGRDKAS